MSKLQEKYTVTFIDAGNCEIASVTEDAFSPIGALARAYNTLDKEPVVSEAVRAETESIIILRAGAPIVINAFEEGPIG